MSGRTLWRTLLQRRYLTNSAEHLTSAPEATTLTCLHSKRWASGVHTASEERRIPKVVHSRTSRANLPGVGKLAVRVSAEKSRNQGFASLAQPLQVESDSECEDEKESVGVSPISDSIGFIGAGQMGEALIRGFVSSGVSSAGKIAASVRSTERQKAMAQIGVQTFGNALEGGAAAIAKSDIIVLGVKPMYVRSVLKALAPHVTADHLIVSIAAGVRIHSIEELLPTGSKVVRVMPNTPCLIGQAASAYVLGSHATAEDNDKVFALMSSVGLAMQVEERMLDAVTGLSGSGPAYVFMMLEAMADGAVAAGLPRDKALALAAQTVIGAARMVFEASGDGSLTHPAVLKDRVASPGGTTITAIAELETSGMRGAFIRAVTLAAKKSEELSRTT